MRMRKTGLMQQVEASWQRPLEEILRELFEMGLTDDEVAGRLGISRTSLYLWLFRLGGQVVKTQTVRFRSDGEQQAVSP